MTANQFKPIIFQTLRQSTGKFRSLDDLAEHLVSRMSQFEEMVELAGLVTPGTSTSPSKAPGMILSADAPLPPPQATPQLPVKTPTVDVSERIGDNDGVRDNFTTQQLYDWYSKNLPATLEVQPPGFEKPVVLYRQLRRAPEGFGTFVKILYGFQGADEAQCAVYAVSGTDADMNAARVVDSITAAARSIYSPQPQAPVQPRRLAAPGSLWDTLPEAMYAETDEEAGAGDRSEWMKAIAQPPVKFRD